MGKERSATLGAQWIKAAKRKAVDADSYSSVLEQEILRLYAASETRHKCAITEQPCLDACDGDNCARQTTPSARQRLDTQLARENYEAPEGWQLKCEKCGADVTGPCGWPSDCPTGLGR